MDIVKGVINDVASRKLAVTAAAGAMAGAVAATGTIEMTWPMAVAVAYIAEQTLSAVPKRA